MKGATVKCRLCGSTRANVVVEGIRHAPKAVVYGCDECGLQFQHPTPTPEELEAYYTSLYRAECESGLSPEQSYSRARPEAEQRASRVRSLVRGPGRLLDVGAGAGAFLDCLKSDVEVAAGVEPGEAHREWASRARGLRMYARIEEVAGSKFDVITLFHTLEHVIDPVEFVRQLGQLLSPAGVLIIEVPNVDDALLTLYCAPSFPQFYYQRAHLYYFSKSTLEAVVTTAGGEAEIVGLQRYDLSNHLRWLESGQPGGQGYYASVLGPEVASAYAAALVKAERADTLWAVARFTASG